MEIKGWVDYERLVPLEIEHPKTNKPLGIVVTLRSAGSPKAKAVLKEQQQERLERLQRGRSIADVDRLENQELERVCACIESWDWGEHQYDGVKPESNHKTYKTILSRENWMFHQIKEGAEDVGLFMTGSGTDSAGQ